MLIRVPALFITGDSYGNYSKRNTGHRKTAEDSFNIERNHSTETTDHKTAIDAGERENGIQNLEGGHNIPDEQGTSKTSIQNDEAESEPGPSQSGASNIAARPEPKEVPQVDHRSQSSGRPQHGGGDHYFYNSGVTAMYSARPSTSTRDNNPDTCSDEMPRESVPPSMAKDDECENNNSSRSGHDAEASGGSQTPRSRDSSTKQQGARPKVRSTVENRESAVPTGTEKGPYSTGDEKRRMQRIVETTHVEESFFDSAAVSAVKYVLLHCRSDSPRVDRLLVIVTKLFKARQGRLPSRDELYHEAAAADTDNLLENFPMQKSVDSTQREATTELNVDKGASSENATAEHNCERSTETNVHVTEPSQSNASNRSEINQSETSSPNSLITEPPFKNAPNVSNEESIAHKDSDAQKPDNNILVSKNFNQIIKRVLQLENQYLERSMKCVICQEKPVEVTLLPCGHFVLCSTCSAPCRVCPVCKKPALAEVTTYLG